MHQEEILAKSQEDALARASKLLEAPATDLEILEEYEPDDKDLEDFQTAENLPEKPKADELTLYLVRIVFQHYVTRAQEFTQGLIERFAPGSKAEAVRFRNLIIIRLEVPEASILIGKQGATLDALQHVVVRCLLTEDEDFPDVMLDIESYREKKLIRLEREARGAAERAMRSGRKVPLSPMSPAERKFIHNCLKEMEGIRTESRGEDRGRHIVVESTNPAAARGGGRDRRGGGGGGGGFNRNRGGQGGGGNRQGGGGGNRDGNRADGNRADGNRADGNRGPNRGGGGNRGGNSGSATLARAGSPLPNVKGQKGPGITEEQRNLLYGNAGQGGDKDFQDTDLEDNKSLLPEYRDQGGDSDEGDKLADEIE